MLRFAAIGLEHRHIFDLIGGMLDAGAECAGYWTGTSDHRVLEGVRQRFPTLRAVEDRDTLLDDPTIDVVVCAGVPSQRAEIGIAAMRRGKDVIVDKPGVTTFEQLAAVTACVRETGRLYAICFSERFLVPAVLVAEKLVADGAIGDVIQTVGMGPHRLNRAIRPDWFFRTGEYGGILVDIASHQIDQFLVFTGKTDARVAHSYVGHYGATTNDDFQDFGEIVLDAEGRRGYIRVDWFTPDGLPTWGDGRLFLVGTQGSIEIRKYLDIEGRAGTDHLFLADGKGTRHVDCSAEPWTFFRRFVADVRDRTQTAVGQAHVFTVSRLALEAQAAAAPPGAR